MLSQQCSFNSNKPSGGGHMLPTYSIIQPIIRFARSSCAGRSNGEIDGLDFIELALPVVVFLFAIFLVSVVVERDTF